jgi:hypothetical protein
MSPSVSSATLLTESAAFATPIEPSATTANAKTEAKRQRIL